MTDPDLSRNEWHTNSRRRRCPQCRAFSHLTHSILDSRLGNVVRLTDLRQVRERLESEILRATTLVEQKSKLDEERAAVLRRAGALFEEHAAEIREWVVRETGGIAAKADLEAAEESFATVEAERLRVALAEAQAQAG